MDKTLENFMKEFFAIEELEEVGFFKKGMTHEEQAKVVCDYFGYETVYEYGAKEIRCHITYADDTSFESQRPLELTNEGVRVEPFVTVIPSIYD